MHSKGYVHRDIKLENILIDDEKDFSTLKLADFGFSINIIKKNRIEKIYRAGTFAYMAPEIFEEKFQISYKQDI